MSSETEVQDKVLVVDDDAGIRDVIADFLTRHDYIVETAGDARAMDAAMVRSQPDVIVLDVMMPGEDGLSICRRLARPDGPAIIMLSAMGEETDRIVGLELGADDYLPKPCNPRELLARIKAVLRRRSESQKSSEDLSAGCQFAGWRLNLVRHELRSPGGVMVNLTTGEFSLLRAFAEHPQRILTRDQLLEFARGRESEAFDRAIDVQISRLRRKMEDTQSGLPGATPELIRTVRNEGYIFTPKVTRIA